VSPAREEAPQVLDGCVCGGGGGGLGPTDRTVTCSRDLRWTQWLDACSGRQHADQRYQTCMWLCRIESDWPESAWADKPCYGWREDACLVIEDTESVECDGRAGLQRWLQNGDSEASARPLS
jgi:hypothetical protein